MFYVDWKGELLSSLPLFPLPCHSNPSHSQALSQPPRADLRTQWCTIFSTFPFLSGIYTLICLHSGPGVPHNCLRSFNTFPSPTISEYHVRQTRIWTLNPLAREDMGRRLLNCRPLPLRARQPALSSRNPRRLLYPQTILGRYSRKWTCGSSFERFEEAGSCEIPTSSM